MIYSLVALALLIAPGIAQQSNWAQCGGIGWTGGTTCVSGASCVKQNDYYSQCIPGAAQTSTAAPPPTTSAPAPSPPSTSGKNNFWFSFGDSYTQTGFDINGVKPTAGNALGNPPYPGYTAVGGVNWVDEVTTVRNKSMLLTFNYAYGGATIDANLVTPYQPTVLSLTDQVNSFLNTAAPKPSWAQWQSSNTLFSFWIGINDIGNSYYNSGSRDAFSDTLLNAYFALVQKLYNAGARNFLFVNVPPIDRSPLMLAQSTTSQQQEKTVIAGFNSKLAAKISAFKMANSGVTTYLWDSNTAFTTILNSPKTYGFTDATSYGQTNSFWGNNYHPAANAHKIFAQNVASTIASSIF